jgi:hypothetical protein
VPVRSGGNVNYDEAILLIAEARARDVDTNNENFSDLYNDVRHVEAKARGAVQSLCLAHNSHVFRTVKPKGLKSGWARRRAQDLRSWAKPKGWRP